jgi:hypothetical protein
MMKIDEIMQSCIYALLDSEKCGNTDSKSWRRIGRHKSEAGTTPVSWLTGSEPGRYTWNPSKVAARAIDVPPCGTRLPAKEHRRLIISNACLLKCIRRDHGWLATNICGHVRLKEVFPRIPRNGHLDEHRQFINYEPFNFFDLWRKVEFIGSLLKVS